MPRLLLQGKILRVINLLLSFPGHVACPECQVKHPVPKKGFTSHFVLERMVEHLTIHEAAEEKEGSNKVACESGLDTNPPAGRCVDCQAYLCQQCIDLHKKQKITMRHQIVNQAEIKEGALTSIDKKHMCPEHEGEELKLFCKTCREVICRDCTFDAHQKHEYVLVKNIKEELVQELQGLIAGAENREKHFLNSIERIDQMTIAKEKIFAANKSQIDKCFEENVQRMKQHRESLLGKLSRSQAADRKDLDAEKSALELNLAKIASGVAVTKQMLQSGGAVDIALLSTQASDQLKFLTSIKDRAEIEMHASVYQRNENFLESDVDDDDVCVDAPCEIPLGLNKLQVHFPIKPDIEITTSSNKPCKVAEIVPTGPSSWSVTFIIPAPPVPEQVQISVSVNGIILRQLDIKCVNQLARGTRVVRGPGWGWKMQDGGPGCQGRVTTCDVAKVTSNLLNARVVWDKGVTNSYCWGNKSGRYDLQVHTGT